MSRVARRYLILVAMLLVAGGAAWTMRLVGARRGGGMDPAQHVLIADIDAWRRTRRERLVYTRYDLRLGADLASLPLEIGNWHGTAIQEDDPNVVDVLNADVYLPRVYEREDGRYVWLSLIASRQGSSFHPPQICYGGWHTVVRSEPIPLVRGELYVLTLLAVRGDETHLVYHFYLWPSRERRLEEGLLMFRVTSELQGTEKETRDLIRSFISSWFDKAVAD